MIRLWPIIALLTGIGLTVLPHWLLSPSPRTLQGEADCGAAALQYICEEEGRSISLANLKALSDTNEAGTSLLSLKKAAESLGYQAEGVQTYFEDLVGRLHTPGTYAILHVEGSHFVAAVGIRGDRWLHLRGGREIDEFVDKDSLIDQGWMGTALIIKRSAQLVEIESTPAVVSLGRVMVGERVPFGAQLRNISTSEVKITQVETGCGCLEVKVKSPLIAVGSATTIEGNLRAEKAGDFVRKIQIHTLSAGSMPLIIELKGTATATIVVQPDQVVLRPDWRQGQKEATAKLSVTNTWSREVALTAEVPVGIKIVPEQIRLRPTETADIMVFTAADQVAPDRTELTLVTSHPNESRIIVPIQIGSENAVIQLHLPFG